MKEGGEFVLEEKFGMVDSCALVLVEEEAQVLTSIAGDGDDRVWLTKMDEDRVIESEEGNTVLIFQNIQKFSKLMGVTLEGMEE